MSDWRPIDTAPKDGSVVRLSPYREQPAGGVGVWHHNSYVPIRNCFPFTPPQETENV